MLSQISNCQGQGRKNKHDILKTDRICIAIITIIRIIIIIIIISSSSSSSSSGSIITIIRYCRLLFWAFIKGGVQSEGGAVDGGSNNTDEYSIV